MTAGIPPLMITGGFKKQEFIIIGADLQSVNRLRVIDRVEYADQKELPGRVLLEMSALSLMERLLAGHSRVDFTHIRRATLKNTEMQAIVDASAALYDSQLYIQDTPNMKLMEPVPAAPNGFEHDVQVIFIDYIGLMMWNRPRFPAEQISIISRSLKQLARN